MFSVLVSHMRNRLSSTQMPMYWWWIGIEKYRLQVILTLATQPPPKAVRARAHTHHFLGFKARSAVSEENETATVHNSNLRTHPEFTEKCFRVRLRPKKQFYLKKWIIKLNKKNVFTGKKCFASSDFCEFGRSLLQYWNFLFYRCRT